MCFGWFYESFFNTLLVLWNPRHVRNKSNSFIHFMVIFSYEICMYIKVKSLLFRNIFRKVSHILYVHEICQHT